MADNLTTALRITLAGMSLVFGSILILWGLMALLIRITADRRGDLMPAGKASQDETDSDRRHRAAAAAVAIALAPSRTPPPPAFPLPPTAYVSAWQAVRRSSQLSRRGPVR